MPTVYGIGLMSDHPIWKRLREVEAANEKSVMSWVDLYRRPDDEEDRRQIEELRSLRKAVERKRRQEEIERLKRELMT